MMQRSLFSILCFVLISFGVASVSAQKCSNDRYFRPNSTYDSNRRLILSSLPSNVTAQEDRFFYNGSIGQEPNRVFAIGMCIPGSTSDDCFGCIKTASEGLLQSCPNQTDAYTWPGDTTLCYVRYSNTSFSGTVDLDPIVLLTNTGDINTNITEFTKIWEGLMGRMITAASTAKSSPSSSNNYYKAEIAALTPIQSIYALMQCTPDLSSRDCENCLRQSASAYQSCCGQKQGGAVMRPSCFLRWDLYTYSRAFGNITVDSPPPQPPVTVPPPAGDQAYTTDNGKGGNSTVLVVAIVVSIIVAVLLFIAGYCFLAKRATKTYHTASAFEGDDITTVDSLQLDYRTIQTATNDFAESSKIGQGGFGAVYKGTLSDGTEVAVKRLSKSSGQGETEFKTEVVLVSKLQHRNLVRLLGFFIEGEERVLVYEYVPNESLDYFLFDPAKQGQLDWTRRYKIIGGVARGILYLHQDSRLTIIHRDLKASNILLDADMNPKISDFGMARIFGLDQTEQNTNRIVGTYGYMSPEYAMHGQYSTKSDIYSFGVLLLEIISGKKNSSFYQTDGAHDLVSYAWRLWSNGTPLELMDPTIVDNCQRSEVIRCVHIGLLCVQEDHAERPSMSTIVLMLTSNTVTLPVPLQPGIFFQSRIGNTLDTDQFSTTKSLIGSVDDASITDVYPR